MRYFHSFAEIAYGTRDHTFGTSQQIYSVVRVAKDLLRQSSWCTWLLLALRTAPKHVEGGEACQLVLVGLPGELIERVKHASPRHGTGSSEAARELLQSKRLRTLLYRHSPDHPLTCAAFQRPPTVPYMPTEKSVRKTPAMDIGACPEHVSVKMWTNDV